MRRAQVTARTLIQVGADGGALLIGTLFALTVRFEDQGRFFDFREFHGLRLLNALLVPVLILFVIALGVRSRWGRLRYGSFEEMGRLLSVFVLTGVVLLGLNQVVPQIILPNSVIVAGVLGGVVIASGLRFGWRLYHERRARPGTGAEPVIVFGAGEGGEQTVTAMLRDPSSPYLPVAILDDDPSKRRYALRGVRVVGDRSAMKDVAERLEVTTLVIAVPSATSDLLRELTALATDAGLTVRALPPVSELFGDAVGLSDIRPITEADLLGRAVVDTDLAAIAGYLQGRRVLVTGAGGSIGSEICRQVAVFGPSELVMLDRDESALHALQLDLDGRAMLDTPNLVVANIRDRARMMEVFETHKPDVVFHAAALKHLPLLEMHPGEAVKSNVFGTLNVLDAAGAVGVGHFVNISTDKAADPISVLGYTKRIAEGLTADAARRFDGCFLSVRFGNVLGSRGSVLTAFRAQIEAGGPITVTDPDVTRYFMTVHEAVQLVVQAAAVGSPGEALVLDMGEPVRIDDVARQLAAQAPRRIDVVYTGLRPGEKLHEDLLADGEDDVRPAHPLISHVTVPPLCPDELGVFDDVAGSEATVLSLIRLAVDRMSVRSMDSAGQTADQN